LAIGGALKSGEHLAADGTGDFDATPTDETFVAESMTANDGTRWIDVGQHTNCADAIVENLECWKWVVFLAENSCRNEIFTHGNDDSQVHRVNVHWWQNVENVFDSFVLKVIFEHVNKSEHWNSLLVDGGDENHLLSSGGDEHVQQ
jgi:hypothetical protein